MSLTGRPSNPPLALMSSSQIFWASRADLPFGPSPPVIAMLYPILIGSPDCAAAGAASSAPASSARTARDPAPASEPHFAPLGIIVPPVACSCFQPHLIDKRRAGARA